MEKRNSSLSEMLAQFDPFKHGGEVMLGKPWRDDTLQMAVEVFQDEAKALEWMCKPNTSLDDAAPVDLLADEQGACSVRLVLNAIATGGVA